MNRREFMETAAAIAAGVSVGGAGWIAAPKNYSEARDEIKRQIQGVLIVTAGMPIRAGTTVYIADDGLAYAACGAVGFALS